MKFPRACCGSGLVYGDGVEGGGVGFWESDSCLILKIKQQRRYHYSHVTHEEGASLVAQIV